MKLKALKQKSKVGGWRGSECLGPKQCQVCKKMFNPNSGAQKRCSRKCGLTFGRLSNNTSAQYEQISGNWDRYLSRLVQNSRRKGSSLSVPELKILLDRQNDVCALSGVPLTCLLKKGVTYQTNASIDRLDIFGKYELSNIRLVCKCLNSFRGTTPVDKFVWWCKQVAKHNS